MGVMAGANVHDDSSAAARLHPSCALHASRARMRSMPSVYALFAYARLLLEARLLGPDDTPVPVVLVLVLVAEGTFTVEGLTAVAVAVVAGDDLLRTEEGTTRDFCVLDTDNNCDDDNDDDGGGGNERGCERMDVALLAFVCAAL